MNKAKQIKEAMAQYGVDLSNEKSELHDYVVGILESNGLRGLFIHLPNKMFGGKTSFEWTKDFPDFSFMWRENFNMLEVGIKGKNKDRKQRQLALMNRWKERGAVIKMAYSQVELDLYFKELGMTVG